MNMERSARLGEAKNQATRTVFILWIVFDNLTIGDGFVHFLQADNAKDTSVNSVLRELKLPRLNFGAYSPNHSLV